MESPSGVSADEVVFCVFVQALRCARPGFLKGSLPHSFSGLRVFLGSPTAKRALPLALLSASAASLVR